MDSTLGWRTPFIILACLAMIFVIASSLWLVDSPRWLILRGRQSEAPAAWDVLGVGHAEREKAEAHGLVESTDSIRQNDDASSMHTVDSKTKHRFFDVFARDVRSRTGLAVFLLGMQQMSGIDGVLYVRLIRYHRTLLFKHRS